MTTTQETKIQLAERTESIVPDQMLHPNLVRAIRIAIAAGNIIDFYKKNKFYSKPVDSEKEKTLLAEINELATGCTDESTGTQLNSRIVHSILGVSTEGCELLEALINADQSGDFDNVNLREEMFDILWYVLIFHGATGYDLEGTFDMGFDKLRARFKEKFSSVEAIDRDVSVERAILEQHTGGTPNVDGS
jgi:NTP pyrophosphatase (non-canonical NTP hydrolase)